MKYLLLIDYAFLQMLNAVHKKRFQGTTMIFGYKLSMIFCCFVFFIVFDILKINPKGELIYIAILAVVYVVIPFSAEKYNAQTLKDTERLYNSLKRYQQRLLGIMGLLSIFCTIKICGLLMLFLRKFLI